MRKTSNTVEKHPPARHSRESSSATASATVSRSGNGKHVSDETIRLLAYQKWEAAGRPADDGVSYWLEAERELLHAE